MHILGYILLWGGFLGFGAIWEQRKENRRLKEELQQAAVPEKIERKFRSLIA